MALQPPEGHEPPDRREVEGRDALHDGDGEGGLLRHPGRDEPEGETTFGHADAARDREEAGEQRHGDVDEEQLAQADMNNGLATG